MNPLNPINFYFIISYGIIGLNLLSVGFPILKMFKKEIRCYQTPFIFVFFVTSEFFLHLGYFIKTDIPVASYFWVYIILAIEISIMSIIIFGDPEFKIFVKLICFATFILLEILCFFIPYIALNSYPIIEYIMWLVQTIGPIECTMSCVYYNKYYIIPIVNVFLLLIVNVFRAISLWYTSYMYFANMGGGISCIAQIILYFVFRASRYNEEIKKENLIQGEIGPVIPESNEDTK